MQGDQFAQTEALCAYIVVFGYGAQILQLSTPTLGLLTTASDDTRHAGIHAIPNQHIRHNRNDALRAIIYSWV